MSTSVQALLLLTFLLLVPEPSETGGVGSFSRVKKSIEKLDSYMKKHNITEIRHGVSYTHALGRRSLDAFPAPCPPGASPMDPRMSREMLRKFRLSCSRFSIAKRGGLTRYAILGAFDVSNEDRDHVLNRHELVWFENILDAYNVCLDEADVKWT